MPSRFLRYGIGIQTLQMLQDRSGRFIDVVLLPGKCEILARAAQIQTREQRFGTCPSAWAAADTVAPLPRPHTPYCSTLPFTPLPILILHLPAQPSSSPFQWQRLLGIL